MTETQMIEWVLPAEIPFEDLKAKDLEECVYWLLDAMGAKDLEWRTGGTGGGAADGGRDLEAHFFAPGNDGEGLIPQRWWIECKGRKGTVEPHEVKSAVNNALAFEGLDYLVIATNTQFSNPTRDWIKEWQKKHPIPKVQLWDRAQLERFLSRHPEVVLRLFSQALSLQGRYQAMESRFWNKLEFVPEGTLADLWKRRKEIELTELGMFALTANEFANGSINHRPWGAVLGTESLFQTLSLAFANCGYLLLRSTKTGIKQSTLFKAFAYLILMALESAKPVELAEFILEALAQGKKDALPEDIQNFLLGPILDELLGQMQDVCSDDCQRIIGTKRRSLAEDEDEIDSYWLRLEPSGIEPDNDTRWLLVERNDAPCNVGFKVDKDHGCPLFAAEPNVRSLGDLLTALHRVVVFRKAQAAQKRAAERAEEEKRKAKSKWQGPTH